MAVKRADVRAYPRTYGPTLARARTRSPIRSPLYSCASQPPYTNDAQRNHHHVVDGPVVGNGNIGVAVASGNPDNLGPGPPYIDLFLSTNSFWAVEVRNATP